MSSYIFPMTQAKGLPVLTLLLFLQTKRGTPCYMAPELFSDDATHSTASDLWALGCVMYECAMGMAPFMSSTLTQLMQDILNKEPPPIPGEQVTG